MYASEASFDSCPTRLRRSSDRTDGFVSLHGAKPGKMLTKQFLFAGRELEINSRTWERGRIRSSYAVRLVSPTPVLPRGHRFPSLATNSVGVSDGGGILI